MAPPGGFLVALRDTNHDGRADILRRFGTTSESGSHGGTGIALQGDALYVEQDSSIVRYRLAGGELVPTGKPEVIVTGLPVRGGHTMHPIAVDGRGNLFVNMGSATNAVRRRIGRRDREAIDPCRELERRAGIWRFSALRTGQRLTSSARYATGIRNADGLAIGPHDGRLYATQHGRDQLAENWPKLFDWKQSAELPAEELLLVEQGGDYGWPYCYYDQAQSKLVLAPEYGGDGKQVGRCAKKRGPIAAYPAHWAPLALAFDSASGLPAPYGGAGVHRVPRLVEPRARATGGLQRHRPAVRGGKPSGDYQVFADGFAGARKEPGLAEHRPAGIAVGRDGSIYITDDQRGRVWRVAHGRGVERRWRPPRSDPNERRDRPGRGAAPPALPRPVARDVPLAVDHAEEAERLVAQRLELMPGERGHPYQVVGPRVHQPVADQHPRRAPDDHDRMRMMVPLERGPAARSDLEIPELAAEPVASLEQRLPRDAGEVGAFGLVRLDRDAFPAERLGLAHVIGHRTRLTSGAAAARADRSTSSPRPLEQRIASLVQAAADQQDAVGPVELQQLGDPLRLDAAGRRRARPAARADAAGAARRRARGRSRGCS